MNNELGLTFRLSAANSAHHIHRNRHIQYLPGGKTVVTYPGRRVRPTRYSDVRSELILKLIRCY